MAGLFVLLLNVSDIVSELQNFGANIDAQDSTGKTPLTYSVINRHIGTVRQLLRLGANTELRNYHEGATALHFTLTHADNDMLGCLLDGGADIEARENQGFTPLLLAIHCFSPTSGNDLCHLLARGANVDAQESFTFVHLSAL